MLPKNKLRQRRLERLKVFPGDEHPYDHVLMRRYDIPTRKLRQALQDRAPPASSSTTP
jgi:large subunit ribosomal protein L13